MRGTNPTCHSKADIKLAHTSHPVRPIWGNKGHNKTLLPSHSVLGHVHSIALSRLKLILPSFAITKPRWPLAPRCFVFFGNFFLQPVEVKWGKIWEKFINWAYLRVSNALSLTAHLCTLGKSLERRRWTFVNRSCSKRTYNKSLKWLELGCGLFMCTWI